MGQDYCVTCRLERVREARAKLAEVEGKGGAPQGRQGPAGRCSGYCAKLHEHVR
jgi:hypothetical protein